MSLRPGDVFAFQFTTQDATGEATNADSTPTGTVVKNGTDDATPTVTVTNPSTGVYKASVTVPVGYAAGDVFQVRIAATVDIVNAKACTVPVVIDTSRTSEVAASVALVLADTGTDGVVISTVTANQLADALIARNIAGGSSTGRTVKTALAALRNKVTIGAGTLTVYDTDDASILWTGVLTSDAAAEPITAVDPG